MSLQAAERSAVPQAWPERITVPALGAASFLLPLEVNAAAAGDPLGFNEVSGTLLLTPAPAASNAGVALRIPYYGVVRPVAKLSATLLPGSDRERVEVRLSAAGSAVAGTARLFAWGIEASADDIGCNDLRAAGVTARPSGEGDRELLFAINTWRRCSQPAMNEYDIHITNEAGEAFTLAGIDEGYLGDRPTGKFVTDVENDATGERSIMPAFAPTDSSILYLTARASQLGLSSAQPSFSYSIQTYNAAGEADDSETQTASFNAYTSALSLPNEDLSLPPGAVSEATIASVKPECGRTPARGLMIVLPQNPAGPEQAALLALPDCTAPDPGPASSGTAPPDGSDR